MLALRYVYVLSLVIWLGGMVILGAIVAPTLFQVLQTADPLNGRALAGEAFGSMIGRFHYVAYATGALLLVTLAGMRILGPKPVAFAVKALVVLAMLGVATYSGVVVLGRIDVIQATVGTLPSRLDAANPLRLEFDALHALARRLMMVDMVGALVLLFWEARER